MIGALLAVSLLLAAVTPPQSYFPAISIEINDPSAGAIRINTLLDGRSSLSECEAVTGNIARNTFKLCPQCRIVSMTCNSALTQTERGLFDETALPFPSGRMANGIITYESADTNLALAACQSTQAKSRNISNPVTCYPPMTARSRPSGPTPLSIWSLTLAIAAFASAWLTGWMIIRYEHLHAHLSHDHVGSGPQKYHETPTPRIGGITLLAGLLAAGGIMLMTEAVTTERPFGLLLLAGIPAFLGGLVEDLTKKVGVFERLLLTMLSGALGAWLLGAVLVRLDIPGIDQALQWLPFAIILTSFAVGGIANAINIIDGYNGLAGGFAVIVLAALALVAYQIGDDLVFSASLALSGALLGFLAWNWPGGKIFLGDGGAYFLGFIMAELSVLLVARNPAVSPWFPLLLMIYPIFETLYSIYRRKFKNNLSPGQPDNQHLHQLIHDRIIPSHAHGKHFSRNSRVAKYLWGPVGVLAIVGSVFAATTSVLIACAIGYCVFYVVNYRWLDTAIRLNRE
jgi:UDP-N-acetylmuramyl pentapeptide phosphotransferase/UDP-N-acetylglucosamine-1-phosphate transferase